MKVKIVTKGFVPQYAKKGDAGCDLQYFGDKIITIAPKASALIPTGIRIQLEEGYEAQVRPRSGLALNYGITVLNTPGTIDSGYISEIGVILINHGVDNFYVKPGDRIAQLVFNKVEKGEFVIVEELDHTERGEYGFGSSGI